MINDDSLGQRIARSRTYLGLSQNMLARRLGVKKQTLENWEADRSSPRSDRFTKMAGILQVPLIWLITGEEVEGSMAPGHTPDETAGIAEKLDHAIQLQQRLSALLIDISADVSRLQRDLDKE